ncbi:MAG: CRISPR-associated protein Cas4, partial [Bryobacteraceae bacterium]
MFGDDELLPISALAHLEYCPRRCALIHIEGSWAETRFTAEGRILHARVHRHAAETVEGAVQARGVWLRSFSLGLYGVADLVEFYPVSGDSTQAVPLPSYDGLWVPFPVEYKRGPRRPESSYLVHLCAQALCLEEMLQVAIPAGAIYYAKSRRRLPVAFEHNLRQRTRALAAQLHRLVAAGVTPPPQPTPKCHYCSLRELCLPKAMAGRTNA